MKRIDERTVELTEAEQVFSDWFESLLDRGFNQQQAWDEIALCAPVGGGSATDKVLSDPEFRAYIIEEG